MTLPDLRVGQIWRCRDQQYEIRIDAMTAEAAYGVARTLKPGVRLAWGTYQANTGDSGNAFSISETDGCYRYTGGHAPEFDLITLLYDPNT